MKQIFYSRGRRRNYLWGHFKENIIKGDG